MASTTRTPHPREKRIIFKNIDRPGWTNDIDCYLQDGGYEELKKAFTMQPGEIVNEVKISGLRGRGGAGFPCGVKWGFIKPGGPKPAYLICNADESEPGTFKDRYIIHQDPHQLLEGMIISCFAVNARLAYIYIRGEFPEGAKILERALAEARAHGFLGKNILGSGFDLEIYVFRGAGAYICGEETGLIESMEGKRPYPRIKPPYFPAVLGLYLCPTIVNNVETLCNVKYIMRIGGAEYAKIGKPNNTGTRVLCVSGDVQKPGYYEFEVGGITMGELIYDICGGLKPGRTLKAVIPGGSSAKVLSAKDRYKIKTKQADGTMVESEIGLEDVAARFRYFGCRRLDGGIRRRHRDGRHPGNGLGTEQYQRVLRPRELRPMHPVPRRFTLDEENHRANASWRWRWTRHRHAEKRGRQYRRADHLCLWRSLRVADPKLRRQVPG